MTTTLTRWWTPAGPMKVEDLLKPGTDPQKDFGLALLAVHKAGAEACDLVSKVAVADEFVLATALAETRSLVAAPAVQTIAKSVSSPQYAGLLLADLLDDAEVAALALYRTCIAKHVAPSIAAQRVGAVFGVSSRGMSQYATLATDPKANAQAVSDLADRTLFSYVSKVVAEEYVPVKETFSKAPGDYLDEHNVENDAGTGRFVRERTATVTERPKTLEELFARAQQAKTEEAPPAPAPPAARPRRPKTMKTMKVRPGMKVMSQSVAQQGVAQQSLAGGLARDILGQRLDAVAALGQKLAQESDAPWPLARKGDKDRKVGNLLKRFRGAEAKPALGKGVEISFVLPQDEYQEVLRASHDSSLGHVMRIGGLQDYAGIAALKSKGGTPHKDHEAVVERVLDVMTHHEEFEHQPEVLFGQVPIAALRDSGDADRALKEAILQFLELMKRKHGLAINPASEISHVRFAPHIDDDKTMVLAYRPPGRHPVTDARLDRIPIPRVIEIVLNGEEIGGTLDANRVSVDPNTPIRLASLFTQHPQAPERRDVYDPRLRAMRTVLRATPADEADIHQAYRNRYGDGEVGKAASTYLDTHNVVNDPDTGQFVREDLATLFQRAQERAPVEPPVVRPRPKMKRMKTMRTMRTLPPAKVNMQGAQQQSVAQGVAQGVDQKSLAQKVEQAKLRQKTREKVDPYQNLVWFDDDTWFTTVKPGQLNTFVKQNFPEDATEPIELDEDQRDGLLILGSVPGSVAEVNLEDIHRNLWLSSFIREQDGVRANSTTIQRHIRVQDRDHLSDIASHMSYLLDTNPSKSILSVTVSTDEAGRLYISALSNDEVLPVQNLFRYADTGAANRPTRLVPEGGLKRTHNAALIYRRIANAVADLEMMQGKKSVTTDIAVPWVKTWRVE